MLQRIRDKSSGPLAYVIVGLIALVFSVWGIGSYFSGSAKPVVAQVGDRTITEYELRRTYQDRLQRLRQLMGENFDLDQIKRQQFRRSVLQSLIQRALLQQYVEDAGYAVSDNAVLHALRRDPRFQVDGSFSVERYKSLLSQAGISPAAFEAGLRNRLQVQHLRQGILQTSFVTDRAVARTLATLHQQRRVAYLAFRPQQFLDQVKVTEAEIKAYYNEHPNAFMREQRVKLKYVLLERSALKVTEQPDKQRLKKIYQQVNKERFKTRERRLARHILVQVDDDTTAKQARARIRELAKRVKQPETSFAEVARAASDDQATAAAGGKLGWVTRAAIVAPLANALFGLEPGEVSNPVKTEFGWHLIKLVKIDPAEIKPFDDPQVQAELKSIYRKRTRKQRYQEMAEKLGALSFKSASSLQPIAEKLGLEIRTTGWVTRAGGEGIASHEAVVKAAFSPAVLKDGLNSTPIQLPGHRKVVLRVAAKQPAQPRPLKAVRDKIRKRLAHQAASRIARARAESALQALREGKQWQAVAKGGPGKLVTLGWIGRAGNALPAGLREAAFALPRPSGGGATYGKAATAGGTVAVLRLTGVRTPESKKPGTAEIVKRRLRGRIAAMEYRALRQSLRDDYEITIHEDKLQ